MNKVRIGLVGFGRRGWGALNHCASNPDAEIVAVCDKYEDRTEAAAAKTEELTGKRPFATCDYHQLLASGIDAVIISTHWNTHAEIAIEAMRLGIGAAFEVGCSYSIDECFELVKTHERTGAPCMVMSNCNFMRRELALLRMVREGLFGEVVHCDGGYCHDLRHQVANGKELRHGRLNNYYNRSCDNYPVHPLGPISKLLDINRGNRMLTLTSMASRAAGMKQYIKDNFEPDFYLQDGEFMCGDIITTTIKCARGQTITLRLDTTLPRPYSRRFEVHGTKGLYMEDGHMIFLEGEHKDGSSEFIRNNYYNNADAYIEKYEHPIWQKYLTEGVVGGHGGADYLVVNAFIRSIKTGAPTPLDVYDTASLVAVSTLSEQSIAMGGMPVPVPDFTNGKWVDRTPNPICEELI